MKIKTIKFEHNFIPIKEIKNRSRNFYNLIKKRRSIRDFSSQYFDDNIIVEIDSYYGDYPDLGAYEFTSNSQDCNSFLGDVNADGILDILDILQTVNIIMGFTEPTDQQTCLSDINQDNSIDIFDIIIMINIILSN